MSKCKNPDCVDGTIYPNGGYIGYRCPDCGVSYAVTSGGETLKVSGEATHAPDATGDQARGALHSNDLANADAEHLHSVPDEVEAVLSEALWRATHLESSIGGGTEADRLYRGIDMIRDRFTAPARPVEGDRNAHFRDEISFNGESQVIEACVHEDAVFTVQIDGQVVFQYDARPPEGEADPWALLEEVLAASDDGVIVEEEAHYTDHWLTLTERIAALRSRLPEGEGPEPYEKSHPFCKAYRCGAPDLTCNPDMPCYVGREFFDHLRSQSTPPSDTPVPADSEDDDA